MWTTSLAAIFAVLLFAASASASDVVIRDSAVGAAGIALDGSGDVFLTDPLKNEVVVAKPDGHGGNSVTVVDDSGLSGPTAVALDGSGDVFIADNGNDRVVKDTPDGSGGYTQSVVDGSVSSPNGVAVDGSGNVYVAATGDNTVFKDTPGGGGGYTQSVVDSSFIGPFAVAVDGSGNLFVADTGGQRVVKDTPDGSGGYTQSTVVTGVTDAFGIAVDESGDVYTETGNYSLIKLTPDGSGGYTQSTVDSGLYFPFGLAVDASKNVFVADPPLTQTFEEQPQDCGCYTRKLVDTGVVSPSAAVLDGSGHVFIADTGNDRVVEEKPSSGGYTQALVDDNLSQPGAVAVDSAGDLFIADTGNDRVVEDKPDGAGGYTQSVVDSALSFPSGVAVDGSGNVFVADSGNGRLVEEEPDGSGGFTPHVVGIGMSLSFPYGIALDRFGDVFIADLGGNEVVEAKSDGHGGYTSAVVDDSNVSGPQGVAVDREGWVFVGDTGNDQVLAEQPNGSGGYSTHLVENSDEPAGLAADPSGNLIIAQSSCDCGKVVEHPITLASVAVKVTPDTAGKYTVAATALSPWEERMPKYSDSSPTWSDTEGELGSQTPAPFIGGSSFTTGVTMSRPVPSNTLSVTTNGITGTSKPFAVYGAVTQFTLGFQKPVTAGQPVTVTIYARDANGKVVPTYSGTPTWSDLSGHLSGSPAAFSGGASTNTVTFPTQYHKDRITVTDGAVSDQTGPFNVLGPVAGFATSVARPVSAGTGFSVQLTAYDAVGDVITNYSGTPTWSDSSGQLSGSPAAFSNGVSGNTVTLANPAHTDRITITDGGVSSQTGQFNVYGPMSKFDLSIQKPVTSGTPFAVTVYAEDSAGNVIAGYSGSPTWSDKSGGLTGSPAAFTNGASNNTVTLPSPYYKDRITVTDAPISSQTGPFNVG
jgi:hypothetical protein